VLPAEPPPGPHLLGDLPGAGAGLGPGYDADRLLRRHACPGRSDHAWTVVPLRRGAPPRVVPAYQHRLVLEPVPAWALGQRAGVRPDRCRAARDPDGHAAASVVGGAH